MERVYEKYLVFYMRRNADTGKLWHAAGSRGASCDRGEAGKHYLRTRHPPHGACDAEEQVHA